MNQKIRSVQGCPISMFGVAPEFAPLPPSENNQLFYENTQNNDVPYEETIKMLGQIKNAKSVVAKIDTLSRVRTSAMKTMKKYRRAYKRREAYLNYSSSNEVFDMDKSSKNLPKEPWWNAELEKRCEEWQAGADDITSVYSYIFCKSNLDNFTATFHYVNDWKSEQVNFDPVSHIIRFYEGFLSYIADIDPNILQDGQFISKYSLTNSLEASIEGRVLQYSDKNLPFFWLPSLLVHIGLEIGKSVADTIKITAKSNPSGSIMSLLASFSAVNLKSESPFFESTANFNPFTKRLIIPSNLEVVDISNHNLAQSLNKYFELVKQTLQNSSIGFTIEKKSLEENTEPVLVVNFEKIYPSYVYSEIALSVTKYIKYEIQNIMLI